MKSLSRVFASALAALGTFYLASFFPVLRVVPVAKLLCAAVAARYTWQHTASASLRLVVCILLGGVLTGAIGLSAGFYWAAHFYPVANQGPLLGIILTGPMGFLAGAAGGAMYWRIRSKSKTKQALDGTTTG